MIRKNAASRIFDTARNLFYTRGVRAVGVDEIVCEAGVTKPSLYRAYKSKDDLVAACLQQSATDARSEVSAVIEASDSCPRKQLSALFRHYANKIRHPDFHGCPMSNFSVEMREPGHPGHIIVEECKAELRATVGNLTRKLGVSNPDALADGLVLVIEGAIASYHVFGSQGPAVSLIDTCETLVASHIQQIGH